MLHRQLMSRKGMHSENLLKPCAIPIITKPSSNVGIDRLVIGGSQKELGIGPLGHRQMLLESFSDLRTHAGARLEGRPQSAVGVLRGTERRGSGGQLPLRPASAWDPTAGREARQRERLLHELEMAQTRAAQRKAYVRLLARLRSTI